MKKYEGIIIDDEHREKLQKMLDDAQGPRVNVRRVEPRHLMRAVEQLNARLRLVFPAREFYEGITVTLNPCEESFSSAYDYMPAMSLVTVSMLGGKWRAISAERTELPRQTAAHAVVSMDKFNDGQSRAVVDYVRAYLEN